MANKKLGADGPVQSNDALPNGNNRHLVNRNNLSKREGRAGFADNRSHSGFQNHARLLRCTNESIFNFMVRIDPWEWSRRNVQEYRTTMQALVREIDGLECGSVVGSPEHNVSACYRGVKNFKNILEKSRNISDNHSDWKKLFRSLVPLYVDISEELRKCNLPSRVLRYSNVMRSIFHVANAVGVIILFEFILTPDSAIWVATSATVLAWITEFFKSRSESFKNNVMWVLGPVARQHEFYQVNSASWYTLALAILSIGFKHGPYSMIAVSVLGVGDPCAAFVGKRYGKHKIVFGKSLEGLFGFITSAFLGSMMYLKIFRSISLWEMEVLSLTAAVVGGLTEVFTYKVDDNLTIPIIVATLCYTVHTLPIF